MGPFPVASTQTGLLPERHSPRVNVSRGRSGRRRGTFSKDGQRLHSQVRIKVFSPGNAQFERQIFSADPGSGFTPDGIDKLLDVVAAKIEEAQPRHEYKLVDLGAASFNFIWQGQRPADAEPIADGGGVESLGLAAS